MEGADSTRGLCRSYPQALPPAPGWRSSDQADMAANWQNTPARRGVTTGMRDRRLEVREPGREPKVLLRPARGGPRAPGPDRTVIDGIPAKNYSLRWPALYFT